MKRRGGIFKVLITLALAILLAGVTVAALAIHGGISIGGIAPKKTAGKVLELGEFNASVLTVREVVGNVIVVSSNVSKIVVKSNLPINFTLKGGTLTVYCPSKRVFTGIGISNRNLCSDYRNGTVVIGVPRSLSGLSVTGIVGDVSVETATATVSISDVVGNVRGADAEDCDVSDVVGNVRLSCSGNVRVSDVIGDVSIKVPEGFTALLTAEDILGDVKNRAGGGKGEVTVTVSDVIGDVEVEG